MSDKEKKEEKEEKEKETVESSHLEEIPDGSGCTEIWEYLSELDREEK